MEVKGYKVFNPDWTCREKQYACPGVFEEDVIPSVCDCGMHFCKKAADCFNYYNFDPRNHVAEVIATGHIAERDDKCSTNRLEIVREITWPELLELVNTGSGCTGINNTGDRNTGDRNTGDRNTGNWNTGNWNTGDRNTGNWNTGSWNTGDRNTGNWNTGNWNTGDRNTGNCNTGDRNTGNCNTGDWNKANHSTGVFNTKDQPLTMFNLPSKWFYSDWAKSEANSILNKIPHDPVVWIWSEDMTEEEKLSHPEHETVGGYLKKMDLSDNAKIWWRGLTDTEKNVITSMPNFDAQIFKEITGVDVNL